MNTNPKKKKSSINAHKIVRDTINLNKQTRIQALYENSNSVENSVWANNWIEQSAEMKSECIVVNPESFKKIKFIIKWWEN
jgi:hypothetical protein